MVTGELTMAALERLVFPGNLLLLVLLQQVLSQQRPGSASE